MVRSRARRPAELRAASHAHRYAAQTAHSPSSVASSASSIILEQPSPGEPGESASASAATAPTSCMAFDKREGVEILPSIMETAPLTLQQPRHEYGDGNTLAALGILSETGIERASASPDTVEVVVSDPSAVAAVQVVATAGDRRASVSSSSSVLLMEGQTSPVMDARARLDTGRSKPRKPPLQQEFNRAFERWFSRPAAKHGDASTTPRYSTVIEWRSCLPTTSATSDNAQMSPTTGTIRASSKPEDETMPSISSEAGLSSMSSIEQQQQQQQQQQHPHDDGDTIYTCHLPLPNTPAIRQALDELYLFAGHTTHPELFLPLATAAKARLVDHHLPRFVARLVRNVSHQSAHLRMFIATALCLLGVVGVFICLLFHANRYLRIIPLLIMVYALTTVVFSHFGLCLYRLYRQQRRDRHSSRLQEPSVQPNEGGGDNPPRPATISLAQAGPRSHCHCDDDDSVHNVDSTRVRLCLRILACTLLFAVILGGAVMLVPDIPRND
ncbi:hypothetical protein SYNPS1DRAFT_31291 [Syncephalis pseudoplumigaleata]|uniref:RGS domain-containing protein n=1 Tax=Syncephalis pseudoplumigaleata TaxID=1712513 RepID=A0A4P9YTH0_9FUNG|nr:hypothetical protein SYNPS1DRAFT_31291 [Syncephalis pseudoplumigaleata]|eukprot:RKP23018.1 hypothetical protein SYNPS1DRAFT_31291 [Syncephalis pseudoplumigaleata]